MAEQRRKYKYEKDIFGKKHQVYFLEDLFGVDIRDMQTFRALKVKLNRDYRKFFSSLNEKYERGEVKEITKEAIRALNLTVNSIESMMDSGVMDKREVNDIASNVQFLTGLKDMLVEKAEGNTALSKKIESVEEEAGISPKDLDTTEKLIRKGVRREAKKAKEGALPFIRRTMPRTAGIAKELGIGAGAAALGPLAPIAKALGGLGADIFGAGKGIAEKVGKWRAGRLQKTLAPKLGGEDDRGFAGEETGMLGGGRRTTPTETGPSDLFTFFDKQAYKASYTEELLAAIKGEETPGGKRRGLFGGLLGGLANKFKGLGLALGPLVGKAGLIAALGIGAGWSITKFGELKGAISDYIDSQRALEKANNRLLKANQNWLDWMKDQLDLGAEAVEAGKEVTEKMETRERLLEAAPSQIRDPFRRGGGTSKTSIMKERLEVVPFEHPGEGEKILPKEPGAAGTPPVGTNVEMINSFQESMSKLNAAATGLSKAASKLDRPRGIGEPGLGNPNDTSDPGIRWISGSEIDMDE